MAGVRYADAQGYENHWSQAPTEEEEKAAKLKRDLAKAKKQAEKKAAGASLFGCRVWRSRR